MPWPIGTVARCLLQDQFGFRLAAPLAALLVGPAWPAHAAGTVLYVPNLGANTVSVVDTSSNTITATIPVGQRLFFDFALGVKSDVVGHLSCSCQTGASLPTVRALRSRDTRYPPFWTAMRSCFDRLVTVQICVICTVTSAAGL